MMPRRLPDCPASPAAGSATLPCAPFPTALQRLADGSTGVEAAAEALRGISREFHLKQRILYQIMQSSKLGSRAPALRQLVSRLNYNHFAARQALRGAAGGGALPSFPLRGAAASGMVEA